MRVEGLKLRVEEMKEREEKAAQVWSCHHDEAGGESLNLAGRLEDGEESGRNGGWGGQ